MMKIIGGILAIASLFLLLWKADNYVAHADDLRLIAQRLDQKVEGDRMKILQERTWELEKEYKKQRIPLAVEKEIRDNKNEIDNIKLKLNPGAK
jgi:hypothetical protein